jgi:hypothetical protein
MSIEVKIGQVWADKDKRRHGRQIRVERVENDVADVSARESETNDFGQRKSRIKVARFDRYRLIEDSNAAPNMQMNGISAQEPAIKLAA